MRAAGELLLLINNLRSDGNIELKSKFLQAAAALPYPKPVEACLKELELGIDASCKTCRLSKSQEVCAKVFVGWQPDLSFLFAIDS